MSRVCIGLMRKNDNIDCNFKSVLTMATSKCGLGISFEINYMEPFLEDYPSESHIIFSVSDSFRSDNCELLLLPDNCSVNGKTNPLLFEKRMKQVEMLLHEVLRFFPEVHLFVGDSGSSTDEYDVCAINVQQFVLFSSCLNSIEPPNIHYIVTRGRYCKTGDGSVS